MIEIKKKTIITIMKKKNKNRKKLKKIMKAINIEKNYDGSYQKNKNCKKLKKNGRTKKM